MNSKILIFETGIADGIFSKNKKFYNDATSDEIDKIFLQTRINIGKKYNFDGKKIFQAQQKNDINEIDYPDGTYHIITDKDMKQKDFWDEKIPADILIISEKYKNIVVGNQMADCPILIIEDRYLGVTALSHCGAPYIDRNLPYQTARALMQAFNSRPDNLYAYVGSCAKKDSFMYDKYPKWATNKKVWENYIIEKNGEYYINMDGAIIRQLKEIGITNIEVSDKDTITNDKFYSHSASYKGDLSKNGQNFVGFFYK